jgi:hypothetical protein
MHADKIQPPLEHLAQTKNELQFGIFENLVKNTNTRSWDKASQWFSPRRWQRKSWIFMGAYHPSVYIGFAIVDAGFLGKAFCYVYFPGSKKLVENGTNRPFAFDKNFPADIESHWKLGNYSIKSRGEKFEFEYFGKQFSLSIDLMNNPHGLSFVCPSKGPKRPFHYTYKNLLVPSNIRCNIDGKDHYFEDIPSSIDFSKGYPPKHSQWNWTSFMGHLDDGTAIGINVVDKFNENIENVVWLGTKKIRIGPVHFQYDRPAEHSVWKLKSLNGKLSLSMQATGNRKEHLDLGLLKSKFIQVFGNIEGRILINDRWKSITGQGVMEEHEAIW